MAKTQQQRDEAAAAKRDKVGEVELRHRVRPGILTMLKDLMTWGGFSQLAECVQIIIMNLHALGPDGAKRFLEVPRHEFTISENVAHEFDAKSLKEASSGDEVEDPFYVEAVAFVRENNRASISAVQRKFKINYHRAALLVETMEKAGIVTPMSSSGAREVIQEKA